MNRPKRREKEEERIQRLLEEMSSTGTSSDGDRDPFSDSDGEYGTDHNFEPNFSDVSSTEDEGQKGKNKSREKRHNAIKPEFSNSSDYSAESDEELRTNSKPKGPGDSKTHGDDQKGSVELAATEQHIETSDLSRAESPSILVNATAVETFDEPTILTARAKESEIAPDASRPPNQAVDSVPSDEPADANAGATSPEIAQPEFNSVNLDAQNEQNEWSRTTEPIPEFDFNYAIQGLRVELHDDSTPLDIFKLMFSEELIDYLVARTNDYGNRLTETNRPHTRHCRNKYFRNVTKDEMLAFLGLCLLHGQIKAPNCQQLFSYSDPLNYHPIFAHTMSSRRFQQILRCLSVANVNAKSEKKVTDFLEAMTENFRRVYVPEKELSLDETLILFRGRLYFRQYIKSKKARYGIKFYVLTNADGYVVNIFMYCGKGESDDSTKKTEQIVMKLLKPYLMKGYHVFMDNFYNDVELSQKLLNLRTHTNGTLRKNRKTNPRVLTTKKLKKGEHYWLRKKQVYVSVWQDKRPVYVITTRNHPKMTYIPNRFGKLLKKPVEVGEYNKYMGGIDRKDQMVAYYSSPHKTIRWYKKVFFHMLDICVWNAFYVFKKYFKNDVKYSFLTFREELIKQLIKLDNNMKGTDLFKKGSFFASRRTEDKKKTQRQTFEEPRRSTQVSQKHWPEDIPVSEDSKRKVKYLNCSLCYKKKKRKETRYRCKGCTAKTPLCATCFEEWHLLYSTDV